MARFTKSQCRPCPARTQCTTTADSNRTVGFPRENSATCNSASAPNNRHPSGRPATRSAPESTARSTSSPTDTDGMRRCRYRGQRKAHIQHVLTAIAVNIERLSGLPPNEEALIPRRPTAFQNYLDRHERPRPKSWRTLGT
ncbi:transposase [Streptomyces sp. NPDC087440]|uniref:transposase n=1 Tax=Streptomyces sp. NPDC087440 TaxID=3365790 RepID=UPI0038165E51